MTVKEGKKVKMIYFAHAADSWLQKLGPGPCQCVPWWCGCCRNLESFILFLRCRKYYSAIYDYPPQRRDATRQSRLESLLHVWLNSPQASQRLCEKYSHARAKKSAYSCASTYYLAVFKLQSHILVYCSLGKISLRCFQALRQVDLISDNFKLKL